MLAVLELLELELLELELLELELLEDFLDFFEFFERFVFLILYNCIGRSSFRIFCYQLTLDNWTLDHYHLDT